MSELGDHRERQVLGEDAGREAAVDPHAHRLGLALQQRLGGQHMPDLGGADAERQRPEGPVGGGVAVAADHGHARAGEALLRPGDMHHTPGLAAPVSQFDAVGGGVDPQRVDLGLGLIGDIGAFPVSARRQGGGRVVQGGEGLVRATHLDAPGIELAERLRARHLVHEVQVDVEQGRAILGLGLDHVGVPHLVEQGARGDLRLGRADRLRAIRRAPVRAHGRAPSRALRAWRRRWVPASPGYRSCGPRTGH